MSSRKATVDLIRSSPSAEGEMFSEFQEWCLRTYGDSGKTKTVTRRKYNKILQTLLQSDECGFIENSLINAKFKFWVKSKGFQVGSSSRADHKKGAAGKPVLYVPVKATGTDGGQTQESISLKRVAVVEDFFDIIYSMHVETSFDPSKAPKHAGQKKTYKAIAETYAFLPREAVTRFLMSCHECQKRMHINPSGADSKENDHPATLVPGLIDYNMPITATYLKHMKLSYIGSNDHDDSSVSSEDFDMTDPIWISADHGAASDLSPSHGERMHSPQNAHKEEDDDSSSESGSGNGLLALTTSAPVTTPDDGNYTEVNGNGTVAPLDFSTTSSSSSSEDQPVNLSERLQPSHLPSPFQTDAPDGLRSRTKYAAKPTTELRLDREMREYSSKSPPYSSGSYDSIKTEVSLCPEDLSVSRAPTADDDDDEHDDHEDNDKINDSEGMDPERLKAFNMFVRLFVDENLDRMVPISKQPKEKIQAIIESCSRQFPEFQERARKRIRTYLKSCRRMKKNGMETRPTPPHLTSAMAENILAAACESETRKAAKRMRMDMYPSSHDDQNMLEKQSARESSSLAHTAYSLPASAYPQDQIYINGGLNYNYRGYGGLGASLQHPVSLTTGTSQSNGPTDLSMKSMASNSSSTSTNSRGVPAAQLSPTEINAVRQLIAGYRESAAFLLRSADELENLILQQN
ncbi:nucleolar protein 4-like b isoform X1 [Polypterus senegalus]|uniref:nucleolar protein 4-like b isoform X1 n=1 Tax=Polypterus senegalus TaxID=55291 RepID=UPI001965F75C|nr:nucleolar protein 4-like b isoform X1 [Polypterus senegalus]